MRSTRFVLSVALLPALLLAGCDFPADADGTLEKARAAGTLRAGFVLMQPGQTEPDGPDADVVTAWARQEGLTIAWEAGAETDLVERLEARSTAVAIGRFSADSDWTSRAGYTLPIPPDTPEAEPLIVLVAPGEGALLYSLDRFIGGLPGPPR